MRDGRTDEQRRESKPESAIAAGGERDSAHRRAQEVAELQRSRADARHSEDQLGRELEPGGGPASVRPPARNASTENARG